MPKFPFTNYHELNLDWILKKVTALFDASEENAQTIRTYNTRLTAAEQTATSAATAATAAQQLADAAAANAENALSVAGTANTKADSALTAATDASSAVSGALTIAQEAQQTAGAAVATANDAAATASGLESLANTANQNATAAVETAGTANQNATAAQTAANTADQKAVAAQQTANSAQSAAATNAGNISTLQTDVSDLNRQISELDSAFSNNFNGLVYGATEFDYVGGTTHSAHDDGILLKLFPNENYKFLFKASNTTYSYFMQLYGFYTDGTNSVIKTAEIKSGTIVDFTVSNTTTHVGVFFSALNEESCHASIQVFSAESFVLSYDMAKYSYDSIYKRPPIVFEVGYWNGNTGEALENPNSRSRDFYPFMPSLVFEYAGIRYNVLLYDANKQYLGYIGWNSENKNYESLITEYPTAFYFKLNLQYKYTDELNTNPDKWLIIRYNTIEYNTAITMYLLDESQKELTNGIYINASRISQNVKTEQIGNLPYIQSFCKYNSHYYSTNGESIAELDENLATVRTVTISAGHGNAFQIGADGYGYISGWNDNNVYKINMSTLTIADTIALPVSGYTTAAVDTVNGLMYIFLRSDYPDTVVNYTVKVWDYINNSVIKTVKTPIAFGAMQGCDFYNGMIYVTYGLGTSAVPSGMTVYNSSIDVVGQYTLDVLSAVEPEGVCIDRESGKIYFNDVSTKLFIID